MISEQLQQQISILDKADILYNKGIRKVSLIYSDRIEKKRLGRTATGEILIMKNHSNRRGYYLSNENDLKDIQEIEEKPLKEKWEKSINKAIKLLEKSNLWKEKLADLRTAKSIGYEKLQQAYKVLDLKILNDYYENQKEQIKKIKEIDSRLIYTTETGEHYKTSILWYMVNPLKIKKMYFGKYSNEQVLARIKQALQNKEKYSSGRFMTNYDVSFECNFESGEGKAWYSEEYKNCGNGHYYLALNEEYAVFEEDD